MSCHALDAIYKLEIIWVGVVCPKTWENQSETFLGVVINRNFNLFSISVCLVSMLKEAGRKFSVSARISRISKFGFCPILKCFDYFFKSTHDPGHNILKLGNILIQEKVTTSKTVLDI